MKKIYFIYLLAVMLFSCEKPISEFQSENFIKFFGSGFESKGNDVIELSDGGYLFTGYDKVDGVDYQIFVGKVDKNGNLVWSKTYGISDNREEGKIIKEVSDGFLIAGISKGSSGITHSFIMKTGVDGESSWYKEFGKPNHSITINDIAVNELNIYVAGQSDTLDANKTDYFVAKFDASASIVWEKYYSISTNSLFKRVFLKDDNVVLVGTDGGESKVSIVTLLQSNGNPINSEKVESVNESAVDALFTGEQLYILANRGQQSTTLSKYNGDWHSEAINAIVGKSMTIFDSGNFMVCGESVDDKGESRINFILINSDGSATYGDQAFRTFQGTVGRIIKTKDNGLILVGTTNPTYGTSAQLIKTDKDYFMLKNK